MNQVPVLPVLPLLPVLVQRRHRSASVWPDGAPPCPPRRRAMATSASLSSPGPGPGRISAAPPQYCCASAPAAPALAGGCSACERPRSSSTSSRRPRLRRSWRPRSRQMWLGLGIYLRKISRRLRKHRRTSMAAAVDDTARQRAEAVARAISYCKETLRRSSMPPPPSPSPSLDDWLDDRDRQEEVKIIASAAEAEQHCDDDCRARDDSRPCSLTTTAGPETAAKRFKPELPCLASPSREYDGSLAATAAVAHGEESPAHHAHGCRGDSMMSSLDELEFLRTFDGDEEMINRHFITLEIPRSGSQAFRSRVR